MKKRKDYKKPTVQVIRLQYTGMILAGSETKGSQGVNSYNWHDETEE